MTPLSKVRTWAAGALLVLLLLGCGGVDRPVPRGEVGLDLATVDLNGWWALEYRITASGDPFRQLLWDAFTDDGATFHASSLQLDRDGEFLGVVAPDRLETLTLEIVSPECIEGVWCERDEDGRATACADLRMTRTPPPSGVLSCSGSLVGKSVDLDDTPAYALRRVEADTSRFSIVATSTGERWVLFLTFPTEDPVENQVYVLGTGASDVRLSIEFVPDPQYSGGAASGTLLLTTCTDDRVEGEFDMTTAAGDRVAGSFATEIEELLSGL